MDGAGQNGLGMQGFWHAQAELAKQVTRVSEVIGTLTAQVSDRPTYKDMMIGMGDVRKEVTGKIDHMESRFDAAAKSLQVTFDGSIDRLKDTWETVADRAVTKELAKRAAVELTARETVRRNDDELERKIRQANRNSVIGGGVGILGVVAAVFQYLQGAG